MHRRREITMKPAIVMLLALAWAGQSGATPITTFTSAFQFRWNIGPNSVGLPQGDQHFVGILDVSPTAGTVVTATQGSVTRPLPFTPYTVFPTMFRALEPFDPSLTGAWSIAATNGPDGAGPVLTPTIANPQLLPFIENLQIVGTGATPTITWSFPDLTGTNASFLRFRVFNDANDDALLNTVLPLTATAFAIPGGLLSPGVPYIFSVNLQDGGENTSTAFTQSPYVVPEPGTAILLGLGLSGLAAGSGSRQVARRRSTPRP